MKLMHENDHLSEDHKLAHLRVFAGGTAEELVTNILHGPGAYSTLIEELDKWFGCVDRELEYLERELLEFPRITTEGDGEALKRLATTPSQSSRWQECTCSDGLRNA